MSDIVSSLFNKLSAYQFVALMLPGASLLGTMKFLFAIDIKVDENIWWFLLASYVIGIIISRIGSIVIEEMLKKFEIIENYSVTAYRIKRKEDDFVETLLCFANLYRSFCVLPIMLFLITVIQGYSFCNYWMVYLSEILFFAVCIFFLQAIYLFREINRELKYRRQMPF